MKLLTKLEQIVLTLIAIAMIVSMWITIEDLVVLKMLIDL